MKKIFLMAFIAFCSVSFGRESITVGVVSGAGATTFATLPGVSEPMRYSCKDYEKDHCIKENGCKEMTKTSGKQNSCMKSCEEMAESLCPR